MTADLPHFDDWHMLRLANGHFKSRFVLLFSYISTVPIWNHDKSSIFLCSWTSSYSRTVHDRTKIVYLLDFDMKNNKRITKRWTISIQWWSQWTATMFGLVLISIATKPRYNRICDMLPYKIDQNYYYGESE
jgi:hypothetical protein